MIDILIAEDQAMVRGALAALLDMEPDMRVVAQAGNGVDALELAQRFDPRICLLDIEMPQMSGIEVAEQLRARAHSAKVIILTTFARPGYLQRALKAGAVGYLLKAAPIDELALSIRRVCEGKRAISPELAVSVWDEQDPLTEREREVLQLVRQGRTTAEIAGELFLSEGTVRNYTSEILQKLGARNRAEAVRIAEDKGWLA